MIKFTSLVLVLLCLWVPGRAQIVEDTISLEAMITRAMSELDFSPVQSGIMLHSSKASSLKTKLATCSLQLAACGLQLVAYGLQLNNSSLQLEA